ncbi:MAG TPA: hypothetical protein VFQ39_12050 [Longimicrobium sp.]|nr:hypothetical protein [Longimicrobium sp.]
MSDAGEGAFDCRNCGEHVTGEKADPHGWCAACRAVVVRRSSRAAYIPALLMAAAYAALIWWSGLFYSRFVIVWLALGVVIALLSYKVARRVLFDVILNRGVAAPRSTSP